MSKHSAQISHLPLQLADLVALPFSPFLSAQTPYTAHPHDPVSAPDTRVSTGTHKLALFHAFAVGPVIQYGSQRHRMS
ncbi:hypothetical protein COCC4DRAFT_59380 [Bipolaris maydis ATCC 48331]|uniref:Uncharacterized protein n=2 Tax=Cochliobolus heterostrophus TaxID=5016 RepID=M2U0B5_COCH5|nr:uncharacterized protein COCC4DRAFT_59380 [Bipolaris maydis ATCC 48331]EMD87516.1 hypothetical protein COCHEDRAFT_1159799 [Bipolaris maydis C5]ENI06716.1 hypothetical protein COCC4DRAFT_59380 [Bipolaris maydis ATCC 48331]